MIYAIYKTDNWHSYSSRDLIGVAVNTNPINIIKEQVEKEGEKLSLDDEFNLANIKQTQNYEGEGEFMFEAIEEDQLI